MITKEAKIELRRKYRERNKLNSLCVDCASPNLYNNTQRCFKHNSAMLKSARKGWTNTRNKVLTAYGNCCSCCGEERREFLAIDHINGDGGNERRKVGRSKVMYEIIKQGYPKDKYRILCHNCNCAIGFYGYCPHNNEQEEPI